MTHPYLDPSLPTSERVDDLLARLTPQEKAGQISQFFYFGTGSMPEDPTALPDEERERDAQPAGSGPRSPTAAPGRCCSSTTPRWPTGCSDWRSSTPASAFR
ncbi:hypothetical protein [Cellulomonas soli]